MPERKNGVLRWVWVLVWSVPGCKGHTYRLPTVCTVNTELAGLVVRLSKFTISPPRHRHTQTHARTRVVRRSVHATRGLTRGWCIAIHATRKEARRRARVVSDAYMIHVCIEIHVYREARTADALKTGLARAGHDLSTRASASCFGCCDHGGGGDGEADGGGRLGGDAGLT